MLGGFYEACDKGVEHSIGKLEANGFVMKQIAERVKLQSLNVLGNSRKISIGVKQQASMEMNCF